MTSIKVELTPEVAAILGTVLTDKHALHASESLEKMDCSLFAYYTQQLWALGDEILCQAPDVEDVMAVHPQVAGKN